MKYLIYCFALLSFSGSQAQNLCNLKVSASSKIFALDANDIYCIAKNTGKKNTLIFTFAPWCPPCRAHLPNAIKLAKDYDLEFYVLLQEEENNSYVNQAIDMVRKIDTNVSVAILKDDTYGKSRGRKVKAFLTEMIPDQFPKIFDYSKYILLNKNGEVIMVTSYKDNQGKNWRSDSTVQKRILPLL